MIALRRIGSLLAAAAIASCTTASTTIARHDMIARIRTAASDVALLRTDPTFEAAVAAELRLPRHRFVPAAAKSYAYLGVPLSIGWDQTISDPYIVAVMTAAAKVRRGSNVLEIGTGSGYQAAVLAMLGAHVSTIEIVPQLAQRAAATLHRLGFGKVMVRAGDGFAGWSAHAPFDAVLVTAGAARVPQPLLDQLRVGGKLVMPIGETTGTEQLMAFSKEPDGRTQVCNLGWAMFVPLTGRGQTVQRPSGFDRSKPWCYGAPVT